MTCRPFRRPSWRWRCPLGPDPASAVVRVVGSSGTWLTVHGTRLDGPAGRQVAVVLDAAQPAHLAAVLMRVYGLTAREQEVTRLVIRGATRTVAARRLAIAEDTVQKHVQSVFGKTGARSRGELVSLLFRTHYEPRVRDNERRTATGGPPPRPDARLTRSGSDDEGDLAPDVSGGEVVDGLGGLVEGVGALEAGTDPPGVDELREVGEAAAVLPAQQGGEPLRDERRAGEGEQLALGSSEPPAAGVAARDDQRPGGPQCTPQQGDRRLPARSRIRS